jgi:hypothetical protein
LCAIPGVSPRAGIRCPVGATRTPQHPRTFLRLHEAAAGSVRSEHRNVDILIPLARQRESPTGPNVPCERRTDPAEPPPPTSPRRQPQHSATAKQVRAPGCVRRSFRTCRLCAIPGVSPRAGIRCPVGALRTPQHPFEALIPRRQPRHSANAKQVRATPCISKLGIDLVVCVHITDSGGCSGRQRARSGASIGTSTS